MTVWLENPPQMAKAFRSQAVPSACPECGSIGLVVTWDGRGALVECLQSLRWWYRQRRHRDANNGSESVSGTRPVGARISDRVSGPSFGDGR